MEMSGQYHVQSTDSFNLGENAHGSMAGKLCSHESWCTGNRTTAVHLSANILMITRSDDIKTTSSSKDVNSLIMAMIIRRYIGLYRTKVELCFRVR
jgi:hypothetical protein